MSAYVIHLSLESRMCEFVHVLGKSRVLGYDVRLDTDEMIVELFQAFRGTRRELIALPKVCS